jgi:hypothetical protein
LERRRERHNTLFIKNLCFVANSGTPDLFANPQGSSLGREIIVAEGIRKAQYFIH